MIRIHHVQISVPEGSLEGARRFYCDIMGFKYIERPESLNSISGLWLGVDTLQLHIRELDISDKPVTSDHVAYCVENLSEWRNRIAESGCEIREMIPVPGMKRFDFRDPFGNRIEILSPNE